MLLSTALFAQKEVMQFKVYGFEEGLSHRNVFKIHQDPMGYIWIATFKGLNRFDGVDFIHYKSDEASNHLISDYIEDLLITPDTLIWMAGNQTLSVLDPLSNRLKKIDIDTSSAIYEEKGMKFSGFYLDQTKRMWTMAHVPSSGQSYLQNISMDGKVQDVQLCEGTTVRRAIGGRAGGVLISYAPGVLRELDGNGSWVRDYRFSSTLPEAEESWVIDLQVTEDGTIWALLSDGQLFTLSPKDAEFRMHPLTEQLYKRTLFNGLLVEKDGDLWLGGMGTLLLYDMTSHQLQDCNSEIQDIVKNNLNYRQIIEDESGVVWVASDYGAIKIVRSEKLFTTYLDGGSEHCKDGVCSARGITEDEEGNIYVSYYNSIHQLNPKDNTVQPLFPQSDFNYPPFGLLYHRDALWTGSGHRIDLTTRKIDTLLSGENTEGVLALDSRGHLWMSSKKDLYEYHVDRKELKKYKDPKGILDKIEDITYLLPAKSRDRFWLGTRANGILLLDLDVGCIAQYTSDSTSRPRLSANRIIGLYEDQSGTLWAASESGVNRIDPRAGTNRIYTSKDGLPNDFINGLLPEGDCCMWFSTDNGLSRLDIEKERFDNFTTQDGLSKNEFNRISFHKSQDGRMYFGGLNGVNAFYPSERFLEREYTHADKILFTSFSKLDGFYDSLISQNVGLADQHAINLGYRDKFFSFNFALANYEQPQKNLYSYKLEGYDADWSTPSPLNTARYNNIPAGNYIFRVRSATGNGRWSQDQLAVSVQIEEAFYKSWWFITCCILFLSGLLYIIQQYRIRSIRDRQVELERLVKERTLDLEREKKKSEDLLHNILPEETAKELILYGKTKAKRHEQVSVLFADFKDFSGISERLDPEQLVAEIDYCFKAFDEIMELYGLEKIKTIGDAYMCAGGLPVDQENNAGLIVRAALEIQSFMQALAFEREGTSRPYFRARIGIHTGSVVSGIVGIKKFAYDIWGDTVNIASRMETAGQVGKVNISQTTYELIKGQFQCSPRGAIEVKNKGKIHMYFVKGVLEESYAEV